MTKPYFRQVPNFQYINRNANDNEISNYLEVKNLFKRAKIRQDILDNLSFFTKYTIIGDERPDNVAYKFYKDSTLDWIILLANNITDVHSEWPLPQQSFDNVMLEKYGSYDKLNQTHHYECNEVKDSSGSILIPKGTRLNANWRENGNFVRINTANISQVSYNKDVASITLVNPIKELVVGSQVTISNVSESAFNGNFIITSAFTIESKGTVQFNYKLKTIPTTQPSQSGKVLSRNVAGASLYYEYYDDNLAQYKMVPSTEIISPVTNFEYESEIQDQKRNIFVLKPRYLNLIFNDFEELMQYKKGSTQYISATLKKGDNIKLFE